MNHSLTYLIPGKAIGAQKGLSETINELIDFVKGLEGAGGVKVDKSHWPDVRITLTTDAPKPPQSGIPAGYEEETLNIVCDGKIVTRKVLVETASKADVVTWDSSDNRKLLQVGTNGTLLVDKGYLKS